MDRSLTSLIVGSLGFFPMYLDNAESKSSLDLSKRFFASCKQSACVTIKSVPNRIVLFTFTGAIVSFMNFSRGSIKVVSTCAFYPPNKSLIFEIAVQHTNIFRHFSTSSSDFPNFSSAYAIFNMYIRHAVLLTRVARFLTNDRVILRLAKRYESQCQFLLS